MKTQRFFHSTAWALVALMAASGATAAERFSLVSAVPDDVFLCIAGRDNPERAFLDAYWGDVLQALCDSGIDRDFWDLLDLLADEEERTEIERLRKLVSEPISGMDWESFTNAEWVLAERLPEVVVTDDAFRVGPVQVLFVARCGESQATHNYEGLAAIFKAAADEVNRRSGEVLLRVQTSEERGGRVTRLTVGKRKTSVSFSVGLRDDVILIGMGRRLFDDALGLLDSSASKRSLAATERYRRAFDRLPVAEDVKMFIDVRQLLAGVRDIAAQAISRMGGGNIENYGLDPEATRLEMQGVEAYRSGEHGEALRLLRQAHEKAPQDARILYNLACMLAVNGQREEALETLSKAVEAGFHMPDLIAADSDLASLRDDPRFQATVKEARALAKPSKTAAKILDLILEMPGVVDYVAAVEYTQGYATYSDTWIAAAPNVADNRFYRVLTSPPMLTGFDRYLPQEAVSFSLDRGIDFAALYGYIADSFRRSGDDGRLVWQAWEEFQKQRGFDVRRDLLDWLRGDTICISLRQDDSESWVCLLGVRDEATARQKLDAAVEFVTDRMPELIAQYPMLAPLALRIEPANVEQLEGFHAVYLPFMTEPAVCGVRDGYLMAASSASALVTCLETAAGRHPSVRSNEQIMQQMLVPDGPFDSLSFSDKRDTGKELADMLRMVPSLGGMVVMGIPDPEARAAAIKVLGMIAKLAPVAEQIDFYLSTASLCTFDDSGWRCRSVTHYVPPEERGAGEPESQTVRADRS